MDTKPQRAMNAGEWGLLLLLSMLWGGSFFFVGVAVKELPPFTIVALRVSIAAATLWATAPLTGLTAPRDPRAYWAFVRLALFNNALPFSLIVWGQTHLASGVASILNATTPLFTVLFAHAMTKEERLSGRKVAGALCGLAGVAGMMGPDIVSGIGGNGLATLAALGAAASYAFASIYGRRFRHLGLTPITLAAGQASASSAMLIPLALIVDRPFSLPAPSLGAIAAILAIGAVSTALAYVIYFRVLAGAGATNVALVTLLVPVTSILLGALFLGERLAARHFLGLGLIALGLAFIDGRLPERLARRRRR